MGVARPSSEELEDRDDPIPDEIKPALAGLRLKSG
jgi:hypothetical protein